MQAATAPALAVTQAVQAHAELEASPDRIPSVASSVLAKILNILLWVGVFAMASVLALPR